MSIFITANNMYAREPEFENGRMGMGARANDQNSDVKRLQTP